MFDLKIFNKQPFLIAEIGVNFYDIAEKEGISDMDAAKLMIDEAKSCGVDAVKFQSFKAETIASQDSSAYWDLSEEPTDSQFELFKKFDKFGNYQSIASKWESCFYPLLLILIPRIIWMNSWIFTRYPLLI